MKRQHSFLLASWIAFCCICLCNSCSDDDPVDSNVQKDTPQVSVELYNANVFAATALEIYYYWNEEIANDISKLDPETNTNPISTVEEIRYHDGDTEVDKWTELTDDMQSFLNSTNGVSVTFGYLPITYLISSNSNECVSAVAAVYKDSPAEKAGLKRGDIICEVNGEPLTTENYVYQFYTSHITLTLGEWDEVTMQAKPTGETITLDAVEMYEDPILCYRTFDINGRKIGYLAYDRFDTESVHALIEIAKEFKQEGVKDLILDLRYNGGGYVATELVLASMLAPQDVVEREEVFTIEDYNDILTQIGLGSVTRFTTTFNNTTLDLNASTADANIGLENIYAIISRYTASASESLLGGLMPYMNVTLIGENSHGKFCSGIMLTPDKLFKETPVSIEDWGIYVMIGVFKNCNGETPCMPNGLTPDITAYDNPMLPEQLGDENEKLLRIVLERLGKTYPTISRQGSRSAQTLQSPLPEPGQAFSGKRIFTQEQWGDRFFKLKP